MVHVREQWKRDRLADALDDTPETVIPVHLLRRGLADAWVAGTAPRFDGVIVQAHLLQQEPWCFGRDPSAIWGLLRPLNDWGRQIISPNVPADLASQLTTLIKQEADVQCRQYGDVYHTLSGPINEFTVPEVRLLGLEDEGLLAAYRSNPSDKGFATFEDLLTDGVAAGAVVEGSLVALAHTNAMTARYGDIGVATDELWRGKGFASSAASIVARRIQERGRTPVWSAGEGNAASLRVAAKLGFVEVSRRVYLNTHPG